MSQGDPSASPSSSSGRMAAGSGSRSSARLTARLKRTLTEPQPLRVRLVFLVILLAAAGSLGYVVWRSRPADDPPFSRPARSRPAAGAPLVPPPDLWHAELDRLLAGKDRRARDRLLVSWQQDRSRALRTIRAAYGAAADEPRRTALVQLAGQLGGKEAYAFLVELALEPKLSAGARRDVLLALAETGHRELPLDLARWICAHRFPESAALIADLLVAVAHGQEIEDLRSVAKAQPPEARQRIEPVLARIEAKLAAQGSILKIARLTDTAVLGAYLAPKQAAGLRMQALARLEKIASDQAAGAIARSVRGVDWRSPGAYELNALAALVRLSERRASAREEAVRIAEAARGGGAGPGGSHVGALLARYSSRSLLDKLQQLAARTSPPPPKDDWLPGVIERIKARVGAGP